MGKDSLNRGMYAELLSTGNVITVTQSDKCFNTL